MKSINNLLQMQIFDYNNIQNLSVKHEPSRLILRGENVCKIFDKIKGITYELVETTKTVNIIMDVKILNNSTLKKHVDAINSLSLYLDKQNNQKFWLRCSSGNEITSIDKIFQHEKKIKYVTHALHLNSNVLLENDTYFNLEITETNKSQINFYQKATNKLYFDKKSIGGIIFDNNFNFLQDFCNIDSKGSKGSKNKNIIIADSLPKSIDFLQITSINTSTDFTNKRIILYYPTDHMIKNIINHIKNGLTKPRLLWIVFPKQKTSINTIDYKEILNLLFWTNEIYACNNGLNVISLNYNKQTTNIETLIEIERILYVKNKLETSLIKSIEDAQLLDNFYFSNIGSTSQNLYNVHECPICIKKINHFSHFKCGHTFCTYCSFKLCKNNTTCPICRVHLNGFPIIENCEPTKMIYFKKLLLKLLEIKKEMENILIYVDSNFIAKGLLKWLKINFSNVPSIIANKRKIYFKKTLTICTIENYYISKNIKNVSEIISIATNNDFILNSESLGYDYFFANKKIRVWLFDYK